ncbi:MAG: hypothetical protein ACXWJT_06850, partial [Xanthobacteraceae bacterium]
MSKYLSIMGGAFVATAIAGAAHAATVFNTSLASPGLYYGAGNQPNNNGFAVNTANGVELGVGVNLRKGNEVAPTGNTNTYNVSTGL